MNYRISTTQIDPDTNRTHQAELDYLASIGDWALFYQKVYNFTALPDDYNTTADPNVREWFSVAAQANAGTGPASSLIRDYTAAQVLLRTGGIVSPATMQDASNAIASSIWLTQIFNGDLPTLTQIRNTDADRAVDTLVSDGHNVDISVWSGNILFVGLGDTTPLIQNLIPASTNSRVRTRSRFIART